MLIIAIWASRLGNGLGDYLEVHGTYSPIITVLVPVPKGLFCTVITGLPGSPVTLSEQGHPLLGVGYFIREP